MTRSIMTSIFFLFAILITLGMSLEVSDFLNFDDYIKEYNKEYNTT